MDELAQNNPVMHFHCHSQTRTRGVYRSFKIPLIALSLKRFLKNEKKPFERNTYCGGHFVRPKWLFRSNHHYEEVEVSCLLRTDSWLNWPQSAFYCRRQTFKVAFSSQSGKKCEIYGFNDGSFSAWGQFWGVPKLGPRQGDA
jgi:hypothetical protein